MSLDDWLPVAESYRIEPRTSDRRLTGVRLPLDEATIRRIGERPSLPPQPTFTLCCLARIHDSMTASCRRYIEYLEAARAWENEGGR